MSTSMHAVGFKPADEKWKRMKAVWEACDLAETQVPDSVLEYFDDERPGDKPGMEVALGDSCKEWNAEMEQGYEIDITNVPEGVRFIRVYNSY